jgi:hypothetical protein
LDLMRCELWLPAEPNSPRLCHCSSVCGASEDHAALEFRQSPKHSHDQFAMRDALSIMASASDRNPAPFSDMLVKTFRRSRVDLASRSSRGKPGAGHRHDGSDRLGKLASLSRHSADLFSEHPFRTRCLQGRLLAFGHLWKLSRNR